MKLISMRNYQMLKSFTFALLFISSSAIIANESEQNSTSSADPKSSEIKEASTPHESADTQDIPDTEGTDKETVSGCSDPDLEMLGLSYMCK